MRLSHLCGPSLLCSHLCRCAAFALLMPDGETLVQSQPIYRCEAGGPLLFLADYIQGGACHNSSALCRNTSILSSGNESMW